MTATCGKCSKWIRFLKWKTEIINGRIAIIYIAKIKTVFYDSKQRAASAAAGRFSNDSGLNGIDEIRLRFQSSSDIVCFGWFDGLDHFLKKYAVLSRFTHTFCLECTLQKLPANDEEMVMINDAKHGGGFRCKHMASQAIFTYRFAYIYSEKGDIYYYRWFNWGMPVNFFRSTRE